MKNLSASGLTTLRQDRGFSLPEILLAGVLVSIFLLVTIQWSTNVFKFITRSQLRQQASMEARTCLETIERTLSEGKASTLVISTPAITPTVPNSQAQFSTVDGSSYVITWSTAPMNTVHIRRIPPGGTTATDTVLASHV